MTSLETRQDRYRTQVILPIVPDAEKKLIYERLGEVFSLNDSTQVPCSIDFEEAAGNPFSFSAVGRADVVKNGTVYELKFVSDLTHEHFLQCACYMVGLQLDKGILWNTRNNAAFQIKIPNEKVFLDAVAKAVTKRGIYDYYQPSPPSLYEEPPVKSIFAVIDTETNFQDQVMSIGIVLADAGTFQPITSRYYILSSEAAAGGIYADALNLADVSITKHCDRNIAILEISLLLHHYGIPRIFAYNASFDKNHLPELSDFPWCDIMWIAAYKQFNPSIPDDAAISKSGRLKRGAGVEPTMQRLRQDSSYRETHNALLDALDELEIMRHLSYPVERYVRPQSTAQSAIKETPKVSAKVSADYSRAAVTTDIDMDTSAPADNAALLLQDKPSRTAALCELTAELDTLMTKFSLYDTSLNPDKISPAKSYREAHEYFTTTTELLNKLNTLVNIRFSPDKALSSLKAFCEFEVMFRLTEMPVDQLSRRKSGIRVNALKSSGYTNMWEICELNYQRLLSINGIGPKNAESILVEANRIKGAVRTAMIATPHFVKTQTGEKAVLEYCRYRWATTIQDSIGDILAAEEKLLKDYRSTAAPVRNVLHWIFTFSHEKKDQAFLAAAALRERTVNVTQELVNRADDLYMRCSKISSEDAWFDYMEVPEKYETWLQQEILSDT